MRQIPLQSIPNQRISATLGGVRWELAIKQANASMVADISIDDALVISGSRIAPGIPLLPYVHLSTHGNFILTTEGDELPDWQRFGIDQQLFFLSREDMEELANG